ncbi:MULTISPECIES: diadenylate cyclase CdaA [Caproicibacterium]|uniref:Diadenylate cyclase n=1 Tax=Caproicibacterium argilliputei TaxID=3030016 RepID=A0AA97H3X7_9FIRM|nr:diadenylate cyclase CdaA [Caproicibacterium argilliputei]WOC33662.1 diadenylate cyclase CdaA [Caproicibacterium argilliputei]
MQMTEFLDRLENIFMNFRFADVLDVLLVAIVIYNAIKLIRETRAGQLVKGIIIVIGIWILANVAQLYMTQTLLTYVIQYGLVCVFVLFQPELRSALEKMGRGRVSGGLRSIFNAHSSEEAARQDRLRRSILAVVEACDGMSRSKTGALIVFERKTKLGDIVDTGTVVEAIPSVPIICNVFFNKAPLHDGAMVMRDGLLYAAGCILPLTKRNNDVAVELGTRHRAAIGMSENSDAVVVVVSEETGQISIALGGTITRNYTRESLQNELNSLLLDQDLAKSRSALFASLRRSKDEK